LTFSDFDGDWELDDRIEYEYFTERSTTWSSDKAYRSTSHFAFCSCSINFNQLL